MKSPTLYKLLYMLDVTIFFFFGGGGGKGVKWRIYPTLYFIIIRKKL